MMQNRSPEIEPETQMQKKMKMLQDMAPDGVSGILRLEMVFCDPEEQTCMLRAKTEPWMKNAVGTLHGGLSATILDHSMGALLYCIKEGDAFCPTIEMQTSYHRPLEPGKDVLIKVRVVSKTKRLAHMAAEIYQEDAGDKVCVSGTAMYFLVE